MRSNITHLEDSKSTTPDPKTNLKLGSVNPSEGDAGRKAAAAVVDFTANCEVFCLRFELARDSPGPRSRKFWTFGLGRDPLGLLGRGARRAPYRQTTLRPSKLAPIRGFRLLYPLPPSHGLSPILAFGSIWSNLVRICAYLTNPDFQVFQVSLRDCTGRFRRFWPS